MRTGFETALPVVNTDGDPVLNVTVTVQLKRSVLRKLTYLAACAEEITGQSAPAGVSAEFTDADDTLEIALAIFTDNIRRAAIAQFGKQVTEGPEIDAHAVKLAEAKRILKEALVPASELAVISR